MQTAISTSPAAKPGKIARRSGWALSALAILFLLFDTVIKVLNTAPAIEATTLLGFDASLVPLIGVIELVCLALYAFPRTAVLGAIALTGHLGGAMAIHLRNGSPLFSIVFPLIIGAFIWGGLYLRERRLATLLPLRS
jgi:hypothetical protein